MQFLEPSFLELGSKHPVHLVESLFELVQLASDGTQTILFIALFRDFRAFSHEVVRAAPDCEQLGRLETVVTDVLHPFLDSRGLSVVEEDPRQLRNGDGPDDRGQRLHVADLFTPAGGQSKHRESKFLGLRMHALHVISVRVSVLYGLLGEVQDSGHLQIKHEVVGAFAPGVLSVQDAHGHPLLQLLVVLGSDLAGKREGARAGGRDHADLGALNVVCSGAGGVHHDIHVDGLVDEVKALVAGQHHQCLVGVWLQVLRVELSLAAPVDQAGPHLVFCQPTQVIALDLQEPLATSHLHHHVAKPEAGLFDGLVFLLEVDPAEGSVGSENLVGHVGNGKLGEDRIFNLVVHLRPPDRSLVIVLDVVVAVVREHKDLLELLALGRVIVEAEEEHLELVVKLTHVVAVVQLVQPGIAHTGTER